MGGEKFKNIDFDKMLEGSPPRGRGKVIPAVSLHLVEGITPAWAGKSSLADDIDLETEDHPRVGGEKSASCRR